MPYYRVYLLDKQARIESGYDLCCDDDEAARDRAKALTEGRSWELWSGTKKIACEEEQAHLR
jgi:hypothetical protein